MKTFLIIAEILISFLLVAFVLMHSAKGEGLGGIGSQAQLFSSQRDMEQGLNRLTTGLAVAFVVIAFVLGFWFN
jgi:preprotein translocase subunit SecG